jgi:hypothetical protein
MADQISAVNAAVCLLLWLVVGWRGWRAVALSEVWWSCALLATGATLRVGWDARVLDAATGPLRLSLPAANVCIVIALLLTLQWQVVARNAHAATRQAPVPVLTSRGIVLFLSTGALAATWLAADPADLPDGNLQVSLVVRGIGPALAAHWLIYYGIVFVTGLLIAHRATQPVSQVLGRLRWSLLAVAASGWAFAGFALLGVLVQLNEVSDDSPLSLAASAAPAVALCCFLAAVVIPVTGRGLHAGMVEGGSGLRADLAGIWAWLAPTRAPLQLGPRTAPLTDSQLEDALIEIRDQMLTLQRWITDSSIERAVAATRRLGLRGERGRSYIVARCLAAAVHARDAGEPAIGGANLAGLGGGDTLEQEAAWIRAIWAAATAPDPDHARAVMVDRPEPRHHARLVKRWRRPRSLVWVRRPPLLLVREMAVSDG